METKSSVFDDGYWLLKVPPSIARKWNNQPPSADDIVGDLEIEFEKRGSKVGNVKQAYVTIPGDANEAEKV